MGTPGLFNELSPSELAAWVTVIVTSLGVIVALGGVWWQVKRQWLLHSANLVTQLDDRWNSPEWRVHRQHCAELLADHHSGAKDLDLTESFPVLSFFENLAYLVRRGAIDRMMVWNKFGWYVVGYHLALKTPKNAIQDIRLKESDPTLWEEFEWFCQESVRIYKLKGVRIDDLGLQQLRFGQLMTCELALVRAIPHSATNPQG
jgi:predicted DNA-binding transcriptional regulator